MKEKITVLISDDNREFSKTLCDYLDKDDDIDVVMPEEDYQKLIELYKDSEKYSLKEISITQYYSYPYAKLNLNNTTIDSEFEQKIENLGLYIDIFPIYKSNPELVNSNLNKFRSYNRSIVMRKFEGNKNSLKGVLKTLISKVLFPKYLHNKKTIIKKTKKLLSKFKDDNSKFYHQFIWIGYAKGYGDPGIFFCPSGPDEEQYPCSGTGYHRGIGQWKGSGAWRISGYRTDRYDE